MKTRSEPEFTGGQNIALKLPSHVFDATVTFYRDVLKLPLVESDEASLVFRFGAQKLWLDRVDRLSKAEIWLEIVTDDIEAAADYLEGRHVARRDEVEPLPEGFRGFWISDPAEVIHLVAHKSESE